MNKKENSPPLIYYKESDLPSGSKTIDALEDSLSELFYIENPSKDKKDHISKTLEKEFIEKHKEKYLWVFFQWRKTAVKIPTEDLYFKLRTARNKDIILEKEQINYRNAKIGIAGLSVGSAVLQALTISGGPKEMKIADFDVLEISNLNRIRGTLPDVTSNKAEVAAKNIWELDPFAKLDLWTNGVTSDDISDFLLKPKLDIFIDEMDMIDMKVLSRLIARENKIPVLMATDNGDGIILDIERFDLEPDREIFHGLVGKMAKEDITEIDFKTWLQLATKIVGPEFLTPRMQESLLEMKKTIAGVPQLGTTASIAGSAISYAIRAISNKEDLPSGRYIFSLEEKLIPDYLNTKNIEERKKNTEKFKRDFGK